MHGVEHGAGSVIDVDDSTANWLIEHAVGQAATSAEPRRSRHNEAPRISDYLKQGVTPHDLFLWARTRFHRFARHQR